MRLHRTTRNLPPLLAATVLPLACTGCGMLGEIFYTHGLRLVVLVVVVVALIGLFVSRSDRR